MFPTWTVFGWSLQISCPCLKLNLALSELKNYFDFSEKVVDGCRVVVHEKQTELPVSAREFRLIWGNFVIPNSFRTYIKWLIWFSCVRTKFAEREFAIRTVGFLRAPMVDTTNEIYTCYHYCIKLINYRWKCDSVAILFKNATYVHPILPITT